MSNLGLQDFYRPLTLAQLQVITAETMLQMRQMRLICGNTSEGVLGLGLGLTMCLAWFPAPMRPHTCA